MPGAWQEGSRDPSHTNRVAPGRQRAVLVSSVTNRVLCDDGLCPSGA